MQTLTFDSPVEVRIKNQRLFGPLLRRYGLNERFLVSGVTSDGRAVPIVPDPSDELARKPIAGKHCAFPAEVLALMAERNIPLES